MTAEIVITGGAGYIGSRLTTRLVESDLDVRVRPIDTFETGRLHTVAGVDVEWVNLRDYRAVRDALGDADVIVHLAAVSGVADCSERPAHAFETNVMATANLAMLCARESIGLAVASSIAVHGLPDELPITAETPRRPVNWYGHTKAAAEAVVEAVAPNQFPAHVIRATNAYGTHTVDGEQVTKPTVINYFDERARARKPLTVYEPGTQVRDFVHVDDVAQAYERSVRRLLSAEDGVRVYPVASGESRSVLDLAELIADAEERRTSFRPEIRLEPNPRDEPLIEELSLDCSPTQVELGWEPEHELADEIRDAKPVRADGGASYLKAKEAGDS